MATIYREDVIPHLSNVRSAGVTITTIAVFIYAQDQLHGIHLETTLQGYAQFSVAKDFMLIVILEPVNVCLYVLAHMTYMEIRLVFMIRSVTVRPTDARLSV